MIRAGYPIDPVVITERRRVRTVDEGRVWFEAALISVDGANVYADARRTRTDAAAMLRAILALRRAGAVKLIRWRAYSKRTSR